MLANERKLSDTRAVDLQVNIDNLKKELQLAHKDA